MIGHGGSMTRAVLVMALGIAISGPAFADVTIKQSATGKGMGLSGTTTSTTHIKGLKMRSDTVTGGTMQSAIFDVDAQKMYIFDSKKKEADVWDMQAFAAEVAKSVQTEGLKASVKPNGHSKEIAGKMAAGYDMDISMPTVVGGEKGMKMTVALTGPMWVVKGAPGTADYVRFYKAAVDKGWIFSDPRAAKGSPGQAKAMSEMYKQLAATGGVAYETDMTIAMSGDGPMAAVMAKMGGMSVTTMVQSIEAHSLPDDLFAPPAGYKLNQRK